MNRVLGLDIGTNSIGWALVNYSFKEKEGKVIGTGTRVIPTDKKALNDYNAGKTVSATAMRTDKRGVRTLYHRSKLRRERLHRVLHILGFLPKHYDKAIDFNDRLGQFKNKEVKLNYKQNRKGQYEFLFMDSYEEMLSDFKTNQPNLFYIKADGNETIIPYDWTLFYLRKKALYEQISKEELAWVILNFNQKRGYYQAREEEGVKKKDEDDDPNKYYEKLTIEACEKTHKQDIYKISFTNGNAYESKITDVENWNKGLEKEFIIKKDDKGKLTYELFDSKKHVLILKRKTEKDFNTSDFQTIGEYIYHTLLQIPNQKIQGKLIYTLERDYYRKELELILERQLAFDNGKAFTDEKYQACIHELYHYNAEHRKLISPKGFVYLFSEDIIFYHRPLKSQKHTIGTCQYEST